MCLVDARAGPTQNVNRIRRSVSDVCKIRRVNHSNDLLDYCLLHAHDLAKNLSVFDVGVLEGAPLDVSGLWWYD